MVGIHIVPTGQGIALAVLQSLDHQGGIGVHPLPGGQFPEIPAPGVVLHSLFGDGQIFGPLIVMGGVAGQIGQIGPGHKFPIGVIHKPSLGHPGQLGIPAGFQAAQLPCEGFKNGVFPLAVKPCNLAVLHDGPGLEGDMVDVKQGRGCRGVPHKGEGVFPGASHHGELLGDHARLPVHGAHLGIVPKNLQGTGPPGFGTAPGPKAKEIMGARMEIIQGLGDASLVHMGPVLGLVVGVHPLDPAAGIPGEGPGPAVELPVIEGLHPGFLPIKMVPLLAVDGLG